MGGLICQHYVTCQSPPSLQTRHTHNLATHAGGELDAIEVWRRATKYLVQRNPARGRSAQWCRR